MLARCSTTFRTAPPPSVQLDILRFRQQRCPARKSVPSVRCAAAAVNINVLGAGIAGVATAQRLKAAFPSANITIVAESFLSDTTTHGAAGIWGPYKLGTTPEHVINDLASETHEHLLALCTSRHAAAAGASLVSGQAIFAAQEPDPFWRDCVLEYHRLSTRELAVFPQEFVDGYAYTTVICEGRRHVPWVLDQLQAAGVSVVQRHLSSLAELLEAGDRWPKPHLVVNCCGNAAPQLLGDTQAYPIRGQLVLVRAPWVRHFLFADPYYVVPNRDYVALGGTGQVGDSNRNVSLEDRERILANTRRLVPSLEAAEPVGDWVGLRPGRADLRVELELLGGVPVVHNYGHGGSGLTLFWGCAGRVVKLAESALS